MKTSSLLSLAPTAMQKIYESTCLDLIKELSSDLSQDISTEETFTSVNGIDKTVQEINFTKAIEDLYKKYHNPTIEYKNTSLEKSWRAFPSKLDISKVGSFNMSINQAMELAGNLRKDIGQKLYGMLLSTKGEKLTRTIFNPLHPIIASELKKESSSIDKSEQKWSISLYTWRDNAKFNEEYPELYTNENFIPEIASILSSIDVPSTYITENKNFNVDIIDDKFVLNYEETKREKESGEIIEDTDNGGRNYIIPGQITNISGIAYPYYNIIYSTKGLAWNMCPMSGANISHPFQQRIQNGMNGGSRICTKTGNSKTQMGVSSLNHSNTSSPLNELLMQNGAMTYANQCLDSALEIFLGKTFTEDTVPEKVLTFKEFKEENEGNGNKVQYLKYIKDRLARTMKAKTEEDTKDPEPTVKEIAEEVSAEVDTSPAYPDWEPGIEYTEGSIVIDQLMNPPTARIFDGTEWYDYIEPTQTIEAITTTGGQ